MTQDLTEIKQNLLEIYASFSEGDKSCLAQMFANQQAQQLTTVDSPLDRFFSAAEDIGWSQKLPNPIDVPDTATWSITQDGLTGYAETLKEFYAETDDFENETNVENQQGAEYAPADKWKPVDDGVEDSWQPVDDGDETGYTPGEERAPWTKWAFSFVLLAAVAIAAIWLISQVVAPKDLQVNRPQIELPTGQANEEAEQPPKSEDELAWIAALEKDTLEGYREYLEQFPNGRFADKAQAEVDKYDNAAWDRAESRNTIAGYEDYLSDWPEGLYAAKAQERIDALKAEIEAAKKDAAARAAADERAWQKADSTNTIIGYEDYLSGYPSGKHASEARSRIDRMKADAAAAEASAIEEQAWNAAKQSNTASGYETYLNSYPNGKYAPLAQAALESLKPSPGKTFKDCDVCPQMYTIASGNADLGAGADEPDVRPNELPKRPVIFSRPFSIAVTEVTFSQWQACVSAGACPAIGNDNGWGRGSRPVINVSWDDAQKYTSWLSSKTGHTYSLPSEAQWEYAARSGDKAVYMGGSLKAICAFANGAGSESGLAWANNECGDLSSDRTIPVGTLSGNKSGLKDMIGNVAEWTLDCNTLNLKDAPTNGDPDLRGSCNQRAVRGGSWFSGTSDLRYGARMMQRRGDSNDFTGFRVVRN